jgi:hypothetical protein
MEHTEKMVLAPYGAETPSVLVPSTDSSVQLSSDIPTQTSGTQTVKRIRSHQNLERFKNQVKILLKLGKLDPIDNNLRIKNENGVFIENSNIINLLHNATQDAKELVGQEAFIKLLYQAGVEPELILNQDIKSKLFKLYVTQSKETQTNNSTDPQIFTNVSPEQSMNIDPVVKSNKRQREIKEDENEKSEEPPTKKLNWIMPENSEEND